MARVPLPFIPDGKRCPTCKQPITGHMAGCFFGGSKGGQWDYAGRLIGRAVDPELAKGPAIDEDES